jgi:hypothetical protein
LEGVVEDMRKPQVQSFQKIVWMNSLPNWIGEYEKMALKADIAVTVSNIFG